MDGCTETQTSATRSFRSPWHVLARSFLRSRDRWKSKYQELKQQIKALRTQVRDLSRSRDHWRAQAEQLKRELREVRNALQHQASESPPAPSQPCPHGIRPSE